VNTILFYEPLLGKFPYQKLAVSQIPGRFSQGWPTLLYASSLSFLSPSQRIRLGLEKDREAHFLECLHAHEVAHQWWGNLIGWRSYHDLWMIEGFSNYLGFLSMRAKYPAGRQFQDLLRFGREKLLSKNSEGHSLDAAGPVWLGPRLSSSKFPGAYSTLVYEKGAWILHMLRYLFTDTATGSDEKFRLFMQDFIATHQGRLASTQDFQRVAEKHMSKGLDLEGNRKLDWFFDQWVYETGIPTYQLEYSVTALKNGNFLLKGKIHQKNVSEYFMMPVEIFGHYGPNNVTKLGRVVVAGNETNFRLTVKAKPQKVTLDENHQILCENRTS
jgi:aminopeptidase N